MDAPDVSLLVGIPYEEMNCWDIAREFYKRVFGIELKHYCQDKDPERKEVKNLIYTNVGDFEMVLKGQIKMGDLILIKLYGIECHIAVYLDDGLMLHTQKKTGSIVDRIERYENLIVGFYRVKKEMRLC